MKLKYNERKIFHKGNYYDLFCKGDSREEVKKKIDDEKSNVLKIGEFKYIIIKEEKLFEKPTFKGYRRRI